MLKTTTPQKYIPALTAAIEKEFKVEFSTVDARDHTGLIETELLTKQGEKQINTFIQAFESGVNAVTPLLDEIQEHAELMIHKIVHM